MPQIKIWWAMSSRQIRVTYFLIRVPAFSLWWCQPATTVTECTRKCALIEVLPRCPMFPWPGILECARGTAPPFKAGSLARRAGTELQNHKRQGYGGPSRNATIDEILWLAKASDHLRHHGRVACAHFWISFLEENQQLVCCLSPHMGPG